MEYTCLDCGYPFPIRKLDTAKPRQCPRCWSYDVVPNSFPKMVETARQLGINHTTPLRDLFKAFPAVWTEESLMGLGWPEFRRVMGLVIKEVEHPRPRIRRIAVEGLK